MFRWLRNLRVAIPAGIILATLILSGILVFVTGNWLIALIGALAIILIGLVVLLLRVFLGQDREERLRRGLEDPEEGVPQSARAANLQDRFADALAELRGALGSGGLYDLPWVLIVGETGAGKTALAAESGLDLPAHFAQSRVFGATQDCHFLLANQAVLVNTAGRYFESDDADDHSEWETVLRLLRTSRPDCPINGLIFAISAPSLLEKSAEELEETGRQLRLRHNEVLVRLGVEVPVYVVVTQSDLIEGFSDTARALPSDRLVEAFGWTNHQRRLADPEERVAEVFDDLRERFDRLLPELLLHEPDPARRRRIFVFPQEFEATTRRLAQLVGAAFRRDLYNESPFLRGVYFTSARAEGSAVSPTLERLGQEWARTDHGTATAGGLFTRELFGEVIVGDESLAIPDSRLGPIGRRAVLGAAGVISFCAVAIWVASFAQNYQGSQELVARAAVAQSRDPSVPELNALRESIEAQQVQSANLINWLGFNLLGDAEERARHSYVDAFRRNFDRATKDKLEHSLGDRRGDTAVKAAVVIASDLDFLESGGESDAPDLADYLPNRAQDAGSYLAAYAGYARWLPEEAREHEVRNQKDLIARAANRLLRLNALEEQTTAPGASFPPVRYEDFGLTPPDGARGTVPGIYTKAGFDGLVTTLLVAVDDINALPEDKVRSFRRRYVDYYDRRWRDFLTDVPTPAVADPRVLDSPYVELIRTLGENAGVDLPRDRDDPVPLWVDALEEVLRRIPMTREELTEDGKRPPWTQYVERLEAVEKQVSSALDDPVEALQQARDAAEGRETDYALALETIKQIVPSRGSREEERKLVEILEQPVLDSFSAVLESARVELDRRWRKEIAGEYGQELRAVDFRKLYDKGGDLDRFTEAELAVYYEEGRPVALLRERTMPFGPEFLRWMTRAEQLQEIVETRGFSSEVPVRLRALPPGVPERNDVQVLRQTLRMKCPGREDATLRYRSGGYGVETFSWTSECDLITLELAIGGEGMREERFERSWNGPLAFPEFFESGEQRSDAGLHYLEWSLRSPNGVDVLVRFELQSGSEIMDVAHQQPPSSVGS